MKSHDVAQNGAEWHELRRTRVTASEIHGILSNPKRAAVAFVKKRLGLDTFKGNAATEYGHEAESAAADWFAYYYGADLRKVGFVVDHHDDRLGCSPDRIVEESGGEERLLEIKCPYSGSVPEAPKPEHVAQVQFQMGVTGIHKATLLYWTPDAGKAKFHLTFDKDWWHRTLAALAAFFAMLPPPGDEQAWLALQEAQSEARSDWPWRDAAREWLVAKQALEAAQEEEEQARAALLELAGEEPARGGGVRLNWIEAKGNVNWKAVQKEFAIPDLELEKFRGNARRYARIEVDLDQ